MRQVNISQVDALFSAGLYPIEFLFYYRDYLDIIKVFALLFAATWIADTFLFRYTVFLNQYVPPVVRTPAGLLVLLLSGYLARKGLSIVFDEESEH